MKNDKRTWIGTLAAGLLVALVGGGAWLATSERGSDLLQRRPRSWERPRRIVVVTLDTTAVSYLGPYNNNVDFTPHLDALADEGALFRHAYTPTALTLPSHTTLFTGLSPLTTGVMVNGDRLADDAVTLAEILGQEDFRTAAFVSLGVLRPGFGIAQGFEDYDSAFHKVNRWYRTADEMVKLALDWVRENQDDPFFLWVHLSDPHEPYVSKWAPDNAELWLDGERLGAWNLVRKETIRVRVELRPGESRLEWRSLRPPSRKRASGLRIQLLNVEALAEMGVEAAGDAGAERPLKEPVEYVLDNRTAETKTVRLAFGGRLKGAPRQEILANYESEVEFMDHHFGLLRDFFREADLEEDTLWIVTSDHGEGLFIHNTLGHSGNLFEEHLRTAWMMKGPGIPAGYEVSSQPAQMMDVLPTLLDYLGLAGAQAFEGVSRQSCWQWGGCPETEEFWGYGVGGNGKLHGVAGYRWPFKGLWHGKFGDRGFDLESDPGERENLFEEGAESTETLRDLERRAPREMERYERGLEERSQLKMTDERREMLRSLGYLR